MNIATNLYILSIAFGLFLIASVKAEDFQPKLPLYYNTTSGIYRAELVSVVSHRTKYVAKLSYIPYAEKPGRFQHSVLKKYEHNVKQSDENIVCHQAAELNMYGLFKIRDIGRKTEDCLRITIYIPLSKEQPKNLSVVIHIHGGSNYVGSSGLFDGSIVSAHGNVIVAIINYRLGMLGFLSDGTKKYPGNFGLRDQVNALKWLKLNCPTLGCNPNSITLWGHSAGAGDINWLAMSPNTNHLFQRAIIQSGTAFSFWGLDNYPAQRYHSLKTFFNCTNLPETCTKENQAMSQLIEKCLSKVELDTLHTFNFGLLDSPGPVYDGFLGEDSIISVSSIKEMSEMQKSLPVDIITGVNGVEGFSFEGHFSSSVKFWMRKNLTTEMILTLERYSLLLRDRCSQNSLIAKRDKLEKFYQKRVMEIINNKKYLDKEKMNRLKAIFANSDAIFDSGFIDFINTLYNKYVGDELNSSNGRLYVYEYLHENQAHTQNFEQFKKYLQKGFLMSTHFDGIDLSFGLPVAYEQRAQRFAAPKKKTKHLSYPYDDFIFDNSFEKQDIELSKIVMTYFTNFIKTGDPNSDTPVPKAWLPYTKEKSYLKIKSDLIDPTAESVNLNDSYIRDDLYQTWIVDDERNNQSCKSYHNKSITYTGREHTRGTNEALERCFEALEASEEYIYLSEHFLIEYERCVEFIEEKAFNTLSSTACLDIIAVRRLILEHKLCCRNNDSYIISTICHFENFDSSYSEYNLTSLMRLISVNTPPHVYIDSSAISLTNSVSRFLLFFFCTSVLFVQMICCTE